MVVVVVVVVVVVGQLRSIKPEQQKTERYKVELGFGHQNSTKQPNIITVWLARKSSSVSK